MTCGNVSYCMLNCSMIKLCESGHPDKYVVCSKYYLNIGGIMFPLIRTDQSCSCFTKKTYLVWLKLKNAFLLKIYLFKEHFLFSKLFKLELWVLGRKRNNFGLLYKNVYLLCLSILDKKLTRNNKHELLCPNAVYLESCLWSSRELLYHDGYWFAGCWRCYHVHWNRTADNAASTIIVHTAIIKFSGTVARPPHIATALLNTMYTVI